MTFRDRRDAGVALAETLRGLHLHDVVVLALPRGGVPVGFEVARALGGVLEVFVVRKIGAPQQPEFGIGAIAEGGARVVDQHATAALRIDNAQVEALIARETLELERRVRAYRNDRGLPALQDRDVVVCDDGLATGVTAEVALLAVRALGPRRLVLAAPVCAADTVARLRALADDIVCVDAPERFQAVGFWYDDFRQTTDDEVLTLLDRARNDR